MKKTAIVTGASGNLGTAVIKKFLSENYHVAGTVIPNDPVPVNINENNFEKKIVDLGDEGAAEKFVQEVISRQGIIDVAVLTVGGFAMGKVAETGLKEVHKQFNLNFDTTYNTARPVFLQMIKQGSGRIFMIGSRPGLDSTNGKGMVAYSLAKSLIFRLAELLNIESKGKNIITSVIVPSTIDTLQNRTSMPGSDFEKWVKPEAIADVIYFYCTPAAIILREPVIKVYNNA